MNKTNTKKQVAKKTKETTKTTKSKSVTKKPTSSVAKKVTSNVKKPVKSVAKKSTTITDLSCHRCNKVCKSKTGMTNHMKKCLSELSKTDTSNKK